MLKNWLAENAQCFVLVYKWSAVIDVDGVVTKVGSHILSNGCQKLADHDERYAAPHLCAKAVNPGPLMAAPMLRVSDLSPFEDAAAGHHGVLSDPTGDLIIKPCTAAEIAFYEQCTTHPIFNAVIPTFMGTLALSSELEKQALESGDGTSLQTVSLGLQAMDGSGAVKATTLHGKRLDTQQAIVLENVAGGFHKPNVLDVKLGIRLWGDEASPAKRNKLDQVSSETTSGSLGLRIAGMRIWKAATSGHGEYAVYDKSYGRHFTDQNIRLGFEEFFYEKNGDSADIARHLTPARREVLRRFANEVGSIQEVLENEESRMYSSSILFVYEGDSDVLDALLVEEQNPQTARRGEVRHDRVDHEEEQRGQGDEDVGEDEDNDDDDDDDDEGEIRICAASLIDFAHASFTPGQGPDENALRGVRNVRAILESML